MATLDQPTLKRLVHLVYDVRRDDAPLRKVAGIPGEFDKLRKNYLERREWSSLYVMCDDATAADACCVSWVLTLFITRHINVFLMLPVE
ncbi:MAG: hypothetical protein ACFWT4_16195 [Citrobacter braakii]